MTGRSSLWLPLLLAAPALAQDYQHALIVIADDLGTDKVGAWAGDVSNATETRPVTPTIDLLAGAGVRFSDAWAMPVCSPTRATMMAGEYPYRTGIGSVIRDGASTRLAASPTTLPQLASDAGLATALFGKWHLGATTDTPSEPVAAQDRKEYPITLGFDVYKGGNPDRPDEGYTDYLYLVSVPDSSMRSGYATSAVQMTNSATDQTTEDAITWMEEQSALGQRRLTVVAYHLPHNDDPASASWEDGASSCGATPTADVVTDQRVTVECLDDAVAELLAGTPDLEDTLVVFFGDNGSESEVGEGNFADGRGKGTVFESGVRVPFVVADGAALRDTLDNGGTLPTGGSYTIDAGTVVADASSMVDVYATVADLLDLDPGTCTIGTDCALDSLSLREVLTGGTPTRTAAWTEIYNRSAGTLTGSGAVRIGDMKLLVYTPDGCRDYDMYDLATDRWETTDLFDDPAYATEQAALMAEVDAHAAEMAGGSYDWLGYDDCCASPEVWYDGVDGDCDGADDYDQDGDGEAASAYGGADCDDTDASVYPGATEVWYDGVDGDCDGADDDDQDADGVSVDLDCDDTDASVYPGAAETWYDGVDSDCDEADDHDQDADGVSVDLDCDDTDAGVYPGAVETWYDGVDGDCDGGDDFDADADGATVDVDCDDADAMVNPGAVETWYDGVDGDCDGADDFDADADGFVVTDDCDDANRGVYPGAADDWYDGIDSDCDGADDFDADADGFIVTDDCDDADAGVSPGADDAWYDGVDANCDGADDYDQDADGHPLQGDCDDTDAGVNPDAADTWYDGIDSDCDAADDFDADADGHPVDLDCDDVDPAVFPGATDAWYDGVDGDCDGADDYDADADGHPVDTDCDDTDPAVFPGAADVADDGLDSDCDGADTVTPPPVPDTCGCAASGVDVAWALLPAVLLASRRRARAC